MFTWIGCLKVRPLTRSTTRRFWQTFVNGWEKETWNVEERLMGSSQRQCAGTQRPVFQDVFDEAQDHRVWTSTVLTWPSPMWLFFISKDQVCIKRNQMQQRQKRWSPWISYQKATCSIASNSGRFAWSGVRIGEGSTLRVTTFLLCNFLNKKCSNINPIILQHHVDMIKLIFALHNSVKSA